MEPVVKNPTWSSTMSRRAENRKESERAKRRAERHLRSIRRLDDKWITPKRIGKTATDRHPCSCWCCGNPRRHFKDGRTKQEKLHERPECDE